MTQEEKELLLLDLCGRIPHRVKIKRSGCPINLSVTGVIGENVHHIPFYIGGNIAIATTKIDEVKPYLRPMSSMTEEEYKEFCKISGLYKNEESNSFSNHLPEWGNSIITERVMVRTIDWLNKHHFDYRGLIPMGLALEAKEGMYK